MKDTQKEPQKEEKIKEIQKMYKKILKETFPSEIRITFGDQTLIYKKKKWNIDGESKGLRYGENPDQPGALYQLTKGELLLEENLLLSPDRVFLSSLKEENFLQFGKHMSKTNFMDINTGLMILRELDKKPCAVIVKHNNPCGVAYGETIEKAFLKAFEADVVAAFGGCIVLNRPVDRATAEAISSRYFEVLVAPDYEEGSLPPLKKWKNLRIIKLPEIENLHTYKNYTTIEFSSLIDGGLILQFSQKNRIRKREDLVPAVAYNKEGEEIRCKREPDEREIEDMLFGWGVEMGVKSNSVVFVKNQTTVSIGTGEQDRVGCVEIAIFKAYRKFADRLSYQKLGITYKELELRIEKGERELLKIKEEIDGITQEEKGGLKGSVLVSDGFFPFRDSVDVAAKHGITAILQPGGSIRDWEVIEACNEAEPPIAMMFTGQRVFRH